MNYDALVENQKGIKITIVPYDQYVDMEFIPPARFFIKMASGDFMFFHSADRAKVQEKIDEIFGKGKYRAVSSK